MMSSWNLPKSKFISLSINILTPKQIEASMSKYNHFILQYIQITTSGMAGCLSHGRGGTADQNLCRWTLVICCVTPPDMCLFLFFISACGTMESTTVLGYVLSTLPKELLHAIKCLCIVMCPSFVDTNAAPSFVIITCSLRHENKCVALHPQCCLALNPASCHHLILMPLSFVWIIMHPAAWIQTKAISPM